MLYIPFKSFRLKKGLSEQAFAELIGLSRLTLRAVEKSTGNSTVGSLELIANGLDQELAIFAFPRNDFDAECSSVAVSMKVKRDGFESWPLHFMELVDAFRKTRDLRLLVLPPVKMERKETAMLASIVCALCEEIELPPPPWANQSFFLERPWFPSETESLKAMALRDSPIHFRRNNIFVQDNFLRRA